ncbi:Oxysterol-binding protein- protein 5 [Saguinus oedipus]|uniref:Oxysterol-binding protein- protein 5 n=1 Tax=Saguinus oedipus TaxID=9490 RepID=A0ABQ9US56_SAGOE|nr:Oxysterol-binding protein- protein 5 [Saguinus oedipus]
MADSLKVGALLIYKTPKVGQWVGTVLLHCCELIERPSKKDGFCFKLFHPLDQSVWAVKVLWRGYPRPLPSCYPGGKIEQRPALTPPKLGLPCRV